MRGPLKVLWAAPLGLLVTGCALLPGMHVDEARLVQRYSEPEGSSPASAFNIVPITGELVTSLSNQRLAGGNGAQAIGMPLVFAGALAGYQYRVAASDVLEVTVWDHPELMSQRRKQADTDNEQMGARGYLVNADGTIFYPYIGVVPVAGKTLPEIRELLTGRLMSRLQDPQLDVRVVGFRGRRVYLTGEVVEPAVLPITDVPLTVLQAIQLTKGTTRTADLENVTLSREGKKYRLDLQALYDRGEVSSDWLLRDGDILNVPDRAQRRVFVLGEVKKPSAQPMPRGSMSLADALADAEGVDPTTSDPGRIYVFREGEGGRPDIFRLDAEQPDAVLLAAQFPLRARDVVFVSSHPLVRWNRVVTQILPSVQALWQTVTLPATLRALTR